MYSEPQGFDDDRNEDFDNDFTMGPGGAPHAGGQDDFPVDDSEYASHEEDEQISQGDSEGSQTGESCMI